MIPIKTIALLLPVYTCLFFAIILLTSNSGKRSPKTVLGIFMTFAFLLFFCVLMYQSGNYIIASYFHGIFISTMLSLLPLFYIYILSLTDKDFSFKKSRYHLIIPLIFFLIVTPLHLLLSETDKIYFMNKYILGEFSDNKIMKVIYVFYNAKGYIFAIQTVVYFILSLKKLKEHKKTISNMFAKTEGINLNWLHVFSFIYLLASINAIIINFIPIKTVFQKEIVLDISLFLFTLFYFTYGLLGLRQKSIIQTIKELDSSLESNTKLEEKPDELLIKINDYIIQNEVYLNPELKIWDIAKELNSNRTYISKVINENTGMNFANYINHFRVNKACEYLLEPTNKYLIEELSVKCGFNSISSFNRMFFQNKGMTPSSFRRNAIIE